MKLYRDALSELRKRYAVETLLTEPRLPALNQTTAPALGPSDAKVTIVEFADFQCPYCKASQPTLKQVLQTYGTRVRLVFKHLPLDIHADAFVSAQAAFCAGEQDRFWPYHDALFAAAVLSREALHKTAADMGLDLLKFKDCLNGDASRAAVQRDVSEATRLGINSTPTYIVNGRLIRGATDFDEFKDIIEQELQSAPKPPTL
jgi:protein-disulfide isomerase